MDTIILSSQQSGITISITTLNSQCGDSSGTAMAVVNGGTLPYTYIWTSGDTTATADNLSGGIYQLIVTDSNGCQEQAIASISDANGPTIALDSIVDVSCYGGNDGAIYLTTSGGTPPLYFFWLYGNYDEDQDSLGYGTQEVNVVDDNGCITTQQFFVDHEPV